MAVLSSISPSPVKRFKASVRSAKLKLVGKLPVSFRRKIYLGRCDLFNKSGSMDHVEICLAKSISELEEAFSIVYDAYIETGYISANSEKMRIRMHDLLPTTAIFVAKLHGKVIGTMSAIVDSALGLPMDEAFAAEIAQLRGPGRKVGEVSSLAVRKEYRHVGLVAHLARAVERYLIEAGCTHAVIAVSPNIGKFYKDLFFFDQLGEVRSYSTKHYDPVVGLVRTATNWLKRYEEAYSGHSPHINLHNFIVQMREEKIFSDMLELAESPKIDDEIFNHFYSLSSTLRQQITEQELRSVAQCCERVMRTVSEIVQPECIPNFGAEMAYAANS